MYRYVVQYQKLVLKKFLVGLYVGKKMYTIKTIQVKFPWDQLLCSE